MSRRDIKIMVSERQRLALVGAVRLSREEYLKYAAAAPSLDEAFRAQATAASELLEILDEAEA